MSMTMDHAHVNGVAARTAVSPSLSELLSIMETANQSSGNDSLDILVAFRKKAHPPLSTRDLTIAFRNCFLNLHPSSLLLKVFITDWLSDLSKSSDNSSAPTPVIMELSRVLVQLNLNRQETEEWMPLLISLCNLADACLVAVRNLTQSAITSFVKDKACMALAAIVLDTGKRVFGHPDRSQTKRERSKSYIEWSQKTLNLTKNFQVFVGEQIQKDNELREHAADMTIGVANMLLGYADEARSEYAYLNLAFKCIVMLVPNCKDSRSIRFETQGAIRVICEGILGAFHDIFSTCSQNQQVSESYVSRRWTLAKFYIAQLRSLAAVLFKDICSSGSDSAACRSLIRYILFYTRSRFISSEAIKNNHPGIQSEIAKFVNAVEEIIVSGLFGSERAPDDEKRALIHEFALASGPRAAIDLGEPLSDYEWDMGRLKFLLKVISIFDEFSPTLQLQLYPTRGATGPDSILSKIVDCANVIGLREFVPLSVEGAGQENGDLYVRILSDLCTFALLLQPKQFAKMQIDMIGLVLAQSELWSLIAEDWWTCISDRLGQDFTTIQIQVLMELEELVKKSEVS
ncbi:hypothetical protein BGX21_007426 [Mortierella sp. AD011]|nr:hypothetical protein BGX20_008277 [Mortierella sp. AD010]KAF9398683.1 hypothetical protein BGX21_007426 [Mortierella sp. AD011]